MRQATPRTAARPSHTPSFATSTSSHRSPGAKGMLSDILLLSFWVAMIPACRLVMQQGCD